MNFSDNIRKQVYENDQISSQQSNHLSSFDIDQIVEDCLHARVDEIFDSVVASSAKDGTIINENGRRLFRIEKHFDKMYYMTISEKTKSYFNSLHLAKDQTISTSDGLYTLKYCHYDYSLLEDEWNIVATSNNHNREMHVQTRQQKIGFFNANYKYEYKIDRCYDLIRFSTWFEEKAQKEGMRVSFLPYATIKINRTRNSYNLEKETLKGFDEWYEYEPSRKIQDVGLTIRIDVDL